MLAPAVPVIQKNAICDSPLNTIVTKKTKTEVSLDIQEQVGIRAHRIRVAGCPVCRSEVRMIPTNEAAMIARVKARDIYEFVNSGQLHFTEDSYGRLYICSESLRHLVLSDG